MMDFLQGNDKQKATYGLGFFQGNNGRERKEDYDDTLLFLRCSRKEGIGGVLSFFLLF